MWTQEEFLKSLHPITLSLLVFLIGLIALSSPSPTRTTISIFYIVLGITFHYSNDFSPYHHLNDIFARFIFILGAHFSYILFLWFPGLQASDGKLSNENREQGEEHRDWNFARKMLFNARLIGTPMITPSAARMSAIINAETPVYKRNEPNPQGETRIAAQDVAERTILRTRFLKRRIWVLLCRYIALCIYYDPAIYHYMPDSKKWTSQDFSPQKETYIRRLPSCFLPCQPPFLSFCPTSREVLVRVWFVLDSKIPTYLTLAAFHDILAILSVWTGLDEPQEWPPLFGSVTDAWTVRRWWAYFWHHLIYRSFSAWANIFSTRVLKLRRRGLMTRYVDNALVFVLSGCMHALVEWKLADDNEMKAGCGYWGQAWWFFMQIGAIVGEEVVQKVWKVCKEKMMADISKCCQGRLGGVERGFGYLWVAVWMFWSMPKMMFGKRYCVLEG